MGGVIAHKCITHAHEGWGECPYCNPDAPKIDGPAPMAPTDMQLVLEKLDRIASLLVSIDLGVWDDNRTKEEFERKL